jgi:hypothetical protein
MRSPLFLGLLAAVLAIACTAALVSGSYCHGHPKPDAKPNTQPITQPVPVLVQSVPNGALYEITVHDQPIPILHLWGTPYQKGFAHGTIMKDRLATFTSEVFQYLIEQGAGPLNRSGVPWPESEAIITAILDAGLDLTSWMTGPYTGAYYAQELQGMADASAVSLDTIRRVQMLGELSKGSCSMFGSWGAALSEGDGLVTMRALDWIMDGPFQNYHQLTVYHADPNNTAENTFMTMGWTGWIGSITGVNDHQMSIHEIGVSFPDASFGNESTFGVPFTYVLRDILQFDRTRMDGLSRLASAHRTCDLILGVGSGVDKRFNSVAYSASQCLIMDDTNLHPVADWHPPINNTVYHAMDWLCPGYNEVMAAQLKGLYGFLTPALAIEQVTAIVQTGDLHIFVADLPNQQFYVSFSASDNSTSPNRNAFDRQFAQLDMPSIFATQPQHMDGLIAKE